MSPAATKHLAAIQKVDPANYPLYGQSLIEASAGTGKTFTIAQLYNRLILGAGHAPLDCDQILVVTFTKAATEELRGRLRARINATLAELLQLNNGLDSTKNSELAYLEAHLQGSSSQEKHQLLERLKLNLSLMDEASIYTIHSFCQRMLQRFAFDTGVMFNATISLDMDDFLQQACEDVWRQIAYPLNKPQAEALLGEYKEPAALAQKIKSRFNQQNLTVLPACPQASFTEVWEEFAQAFNLAQAAAQATSPAEITDLLRNSAVKANYRLDWLEGTEKNGFNGWSPQNFNYLNGTVSFQLPPNLDRFSQEFIYEKAAAKKGLVPEHALFRSVDNLFKAHQKITVLLQHGWFENIKTRFFELLNKASTLTPNDLMRLLHTALHSAQGADLAAQIRELYPFAMIDEFQDTDSLQYEIFNTLYPAPTEATATEPELEPAPKPAHGFIMIGDPKQAIYAFRGADIFTYIKAKQALPASAVFTLNTNYRSHSHLVAGINHLYAQAQDPFKFNEFIPFHPVESGHLHEEQRFQVGTQTQQPLQIFCHTAAVKNSQALQLASQQCALKIQELLTGEAYLGQRLVQAQDITVLVRNRKQASLISEALRNQGINSVFLSQDSVYKTQDAQDLYRWLQAIAHPNDERKLRMALTSAIQGLSAQNLAELLVNETAWEQALQQNQTYHQLWQQRGIMAALMAWLETNQLAERLRSLHEGERRLTNILHLGDLLQTASRKLQGHEALLRWFGERIFNRESTSQEAQMRLESDANLVSIVTIHRSKGLQYPLVFLPFIWADKNEPNKYKDASYYDEQRQEVVLNFDTSNAEAQEKKLKAATAENLRLLYVALTRAEQGCFIWLMNNTSHNKSAAHESALGALLNLGPLAKDTEPDWSALSQTYMPQIYFGALPNWRTAPRPATSQTHNLPQAQNFTVPPFDFWRVSSYSALAAPSTEQFAQQELPFIAKNDESSLSNQVDYLTALNPNLAANQTDVFNPENLALTFVKGAQAGNCLHDILEIWDFHNPDQLANLCQEKLDFYGLHLEPERLPDLAAWLEAVVNTPLQNNFGADFCLTHLQPSSRLSEMEFHVPVNNLLEPKHLDSLLAASWRFSFSPLTGFLKGFIDLTFEHQGRYYVADYKSNFLGSTAAAYLPENLSHAMQEHAYDLQAWIYTLALDALLRLRLGANYQPEQHLGGTYYLFLRGMHLGAAAPPQTNLGVYYLAPDLTQLQRWRKTFFTAQETSA